MTSKSTGDDGVTHPGDIVRLDFELWSEIGGKSELLDTTREEVARKAGGEPAEGTTWGPRAHQIGGDYFPAGIENSLLGLKIGEEVDREFSPADAFGERVPDLIELFSMHEIQRLPEMRKEDAHLDLGTTLSHRGATRPRRPVDRPGPGRLQPAVHRAQGAGEVRGRLEDRQAGRAPRSIIELQYGRSAEFHIETHEHTVS